MIQRPSSLVARMNDSRSCPNGLSEAREWREGAGSPPSGHGSDATCSEQACPFAGAETEAPDAVAAPNGAGGAGAPKGSGTPCGGGTDAASVKAAASPLSGGGSEPDG